MLKLQYLGHLMQRTDSLEKTLMLGKIEGKRRRGWGRDGWMASPTWWPRVWVSSGSWWWTGKPGVLRSMGSQRAGHDWVTELNWIWYWDSIAQTGTIICNLSLLLHLKVVVSLFLSNEMCAEVIRISSRSGNLRMRWTIHSLAAYKRWWGPKG